MIFYISTVSMLHITFHEAFYFLYATGIPISPVASGAWSRAAAHPAMSLDPEQIVVIYNRVPKTGSTSLIGLAYDLCTTNAFNVIHINTSRNSPTLSLSDQVLTQNTIS